MPAVNYEQSHTQHALNTSWPQLVAPRCYCRRDIVPRPVKELLLYTRY